MSSRKPNLSELLDKNLSKSSEAERRENKTVTDILKRFTGLEPQSSKALPEPESPKETLQSANLEPQSPNLEPQRLEAPTLQSSEVPKERWSERYDEAQMPSRQGVSVIRGAIPKELARWVRVWCVENDIEIKNLLRGLLERHRREVLEPQSLDAPKPHHDLINQIYDKIIQSDPMEIYSWLTGNQATDRDREAVKGIADVAIKHGIVYSVRNAKGPIKYFAYCLDAITRAARQKADVPDLESEISKLIQSGKVPRQV